ncbi:MAG TPA: transglycosylase SLT domain-containing protein [Usitatibacter sp.]|nr:transglycosylase SLT domain-containing protein [Usitatibacter sp.]
MALLLAAGIVSAATPPPASPAPPSLPAAFDDVDDVPLPDPDLWQRIRLGFALEALDSPLVAEHEAWYASRPEYIKRFVDRGSLYLHYIVEQVEKRGMPMEIALLPVIESAFNPKAYSRSKASGIWQFIPSTGKNYGLSQDWWKDNRRDIVAATDAALSYLQRLHDMFGTWELALAAYNCGEGCVARAVSYNQRRGLPTDYASLNLPPETRNYVPKLFAIKNIVLSPASYGLELESVPDEPYFKTVKAPAKIDVKVAAKLAGLSVEEFTALNPAMNKPVAAGSGTFILPVASVETFNANLESYDQPLVSWTTYPGHRGESLDAIARKHHLTAAQVRTANEDVKLDKRGRLKVATNIMVPMTGHAADAKTAKATARPAAEKAAVEAPPPSERSYVVRQGDTLYGIAVRHRTHMDAIARENHLGASAMLRPGQRLRIP